MKSLRKITVIFIVLAIVIYNLIGVKSISANIDTKKPVRVSVLLYKFNTLYLSQVQKALEDIQAQNKDNVEFTFYDGKDNQAIQEEAIDNLIKQGNIDRIFANLVNKGSDSVNNLIKKVKQSGVPVIFFNYAEPETLDIIKAYNKAFAIGSSAEEVGSLEGKIVGDAWNTNKEKIDKNKDNKLQYVMLEGFSQNISNELSKTFVSTIKNAGIETEQLIAVYAKYNKELARNAVSSVFLKYGNKIEAIISNNDAMAIGAIEALQKYGYNKGNPSKIILVVGVDAILEARELIDNGYMAGSVAQDPRFVAEAFYNIGMNLINNESPLKGTNYRVDKSGVQVLAPFQIYKKK